MTDDIRVVLCDDHGIVRSGLRRILESEHGLTVVGETGSIVDVVTIVSATKPDVLVLDVGLPDGSGLDAIASVQTASPRTRVLMLTVHDDIAYLRRAFDAGATGYLLKEAADVDLITAVRQVANGGEYVHPSLGAALLNAEAGTTRPSGPGGELSERETEVLVLLARGLTNAEVAAELFVSIRTVETHRAHIGQKLNVRTRAQLVQAATKAGLLE